MGKQILYCGDCGRSLRQEDFDRLKAGYLQNSPYCVECCPNVVFNTPPAPKQGSPFPSSTKVRALPASTPSRSHAAGSSSNKALPATFAAAIGGALVVVALAAVLSSSSKPAPKPAIERAPDPVVETPAPKPEPKPEPEPPRPRPVPVRPAEPEKPLLPEAPSAVLDRYLADIRAIRESDPAFKRADEVRSMLRRAVEISGPRKAEVAALLASYDKETAKPAPEPAPAAKPAPPKPPPADAKIVSFTLVNADTEKPVPGFDPMPPEAALDLGKLGLKKIDIRINTSPASVGPVETVVDSAKPRIEQSAPYSFTTNSAAAGYTGWTPSAGRHTLKCRMSGGPWVSLNFTIVETR